MAGVFSSVDRNQSAQSGYLGQPQSAPNTNLNTPEYYQTQRANIGQQIAPGTTAAYQGAIAPGARDNAVNQSGIGGAGTGLNTTDPNAAGYTLGPAPDAGAIRRRLLGSIPGASSDLALPYDAGFDTGVQNLYATEMQKLAGYDQNQGSLQTAYEKNRDYQLQNQDADMTALMNRLAFQGILSSGITTDQRALLGQKYAQSLDKLATAQSSALQQLAQQRLATQGEYSTKLSDLETGYSGNVAKWLQDQANQQAARQQQQASDAANAALLSQIQGNQTASNQQIAQLLQQLAAQNGLTLGG